MVPFTFLTMQRFRTLGFHVSFLQTTETQTFLEAKAGFFFWALSKEISAFIEWVSTTVTAKQAWRFGLYN